MVTLAQLVVAEDCGSSGPGFKPQMLPVQKYAVEEDLLR